MKTETDLAKPNSIVILTDDWGYGDLDCYENETIQTPCLDRLAEQGSRSTHFYVTSPVRSPSGLDTAVAIFQKERNSACFK